MSNEYIINIGEKINKLRNQRGLSIRELAERSTVSAGFISQIENGKTNPSVTVLYEIATALQVSIKAFFDTADTGTAAVDKTPGEMVYSRSGEVLDASMLSAGAYPPIVRRGKHATIELMGGVRWSRLTRKSQEHIEFLELQYQPQAQSGETFSRHIGREFGVILEGTLTVYLGFEEYQLGVGDSILFESSTPHRLVNAGATVMRALWVAFNLDTDNDQL
jgi:DNA-binding XRE family transcriptional regulator/mannose-6-phosphate isomerase-like protein (cupin superfamily)